MARRKSGETVATFFQSPGESPEILAEVRVAGLESAAACLGMRQSFPLWHCHFRFRLGFHLHRPRPMARPKHTSGIASASPLSAVDDPGTQSECSLSFRSLRPSPPAALLRALHLWPLPLILYGRAFSSAEWRASSAQCLRCLYLLGELRIYIYICVCVFREMTGDRVGGWHHSPHEGVFLLSLVNRDGNQVLHISWTIVSTNCSMLASPCCSIRLSPLSADGAIDAAILSPEAESTTITPPQSLFIFSVEKQTNHKNCVCVRACVRSLARSACLLSTTTESAMLMMIPIAVSILSRCSVSSDRRKLQ